MWKIASLKCSFLLFLKNFFLLRIGFKLLNVVYIWLPSVVVRTLFPYSLTFEIFRSNLYLRRRWYYPTVKSWNNYQTRNLQSKWAIPFLVFHKKNYGFILICFVPIRFWKFTPTLRRSVRLIKITSVVWQFLSGDPSVMSSVISSVWHCWIVSRGTFKSKLAFLKLALGLFVNWSKMIWSFLLRVSFLVEVVLHKDYLMTW